MEVFLWSNSASSFFDASAEDLSVAGDSSDLWFFEEIVCHFCCLHGYDEDPANVEMNGNKLDHYFISNFQSFTVVITQVLYLSSSIKGIDI